MEIDEDIFWDEDSLAEIEEEDCPKCMGMTCAYCSSINLEETIKE